MAKGKREKELARKLKRSAKLIAGASDGRREPTKKVQRVVDDLGKVLTCATPGQTLFRPRHFAPDLDSCAPPPCCARAHRRDRPCAARPLALELARRYRLLPLY
jgi:hypothetical protein